MVSDEQFKAMIQRAMTELSRDHVESLEHVAILIADEPSPEQRQKLKLRGNDLLFGLYEGVPRTQRSGYESGMLPDTITLFKHPIAAVSRSETDFYEQVKRTLWHEIAHYYGISHDEMDALQRKNL